MSVPFYFDHNMPRVIAAVLRDRGIDVLTARDDGHEFRPDDQLLQRANYLGRIVVTQDHDFLEITHAWQSAGRPFAGVVFSHAMRVSIGTLINDLEMVARVVTAEEFANTVVWIPF
jgi:hypothetical protein